MLLFMVLQSLLLLHFFLPFATSQIGVQTGNWGIQPNGTYRNPIIAGDYSDPDVLSENGEYYLVSSTFWFSPGLIILRSRDLVSWEMFGSVVPDTVEAFNNDTSYGWEQMNQYNYGIYAPSIRKNNGTYYIFYNAVRTGFYVSTADNIAGPWKTEVLLDMAGRPLLTGYMWDDPCPIWTEDGKAYLVSSKFRGAWYPHLFQMTTDGKQLLDGNLTTMSQYGLFSSDGTVIWTDYSSEGNKHYYWNNEHYFFWTELTNGVGPQRAGYMMRSPNIYGTLANGTAGSPGNAGTYEHQQVVNYGTPVAAREPTQGTVLQDACGEWWFIAQLGAIGPEGRPLCLLPVTWNKTTGFPALGADPIDGDGQMTWDGGVPPCHIHNSTSHIYTQGSDNFNSPTLDLQWTWNYQPRAGYWSLSERPGYLRLRAWKQLTPGNFDKTGNMLMQKSLRSIQIRITAKISFSGFVAGQIGGLAHWAPVLSSSSIGIYQPATAANTTESLDRQILVQTTGSPNVTTPVPAGVQEVWFRSHAAYNEIQSFEYSFDGTMWTSLGGNYTLTYNDYRGSLIALFTYDNVQEGGWMDVDDFEYCFDHGWGLEC